MKKIDEFNAEDRISIKLLENSIHFLSGDIDEESISACIRWITYENLSHKEGKTLTLYINSPVGDRNSSHPIRTIGIGNVMSAAFLIFVSGTKGERYIAQNTGIMCHQYSDSPEGKHHDLKSSMKEGENCNARMLEIIKDATGLTASKIKARLLPASDVYLTADEALVLGIADYIL